MVIFFTFISYFFFAQYILGDNELIINTYYRILLDPIAGQGSS